jgi:hypothetical protein
VLTSSLAPAAFIALMLRHTKLHRWLIASPVIPYLFDVAENVTHYTLAGSWPDDSGLLWTVAPAFTAAKWLSLVCVVAIAAFTVRVRLTTGASRDADQGGCGMNCSSWFGIRPGRRAEDRGFEPLRLLHQHDFPSL